MHHRHWLLLAAAAALFYAFVLIRLNFILTLYATYGDTDIHSATALAIALIAAWLALELTHYIRTGSRGTCTCGYSLKGVKCPECGRDLGSH